MRERYQLFTGLGLILLILGSGVIVSHALLAADPAQFSSAQHAPSSSENSVASVSPAVISSATDAPPASPAASRVPINHANQALLETLPGIGPARAQAMLEARQTGPFRNLDDIRARVPKIPRSVLEDISSEITFEE